VKSTSTKNHAAVALKVFFTWAHKKRLVSDNPTFGLSTQKSPPRARVLTDDELRGVWTATDKIGGHFGTIVKLLVVTGQRRGEIAALQTSWIKNSTITTPASIAKNGREHTIPLGTLCGEFLLTNGQTNCLYFPARGKTDTPFNGWSKAKDALDKLSGVQDWTLHDLRRTFATRLAEMGIAPHIIERLLNHVSGTISGVAAVYNRHHFLPEMKDAIDKWEARLAAILAASETAEEARAA
jgi:integrase